VTAWKGVVSVVGMVVLLTDFWDLVRSLVVPRSWARGPMVLIIRAMRQGARLMMEKVDHFETRDRLLATLEPLLILARLGLWLITAVIGYGLVIWSTEPVNLQSAFIRSGSDIFTLGFASPRGGGQSVVSFLAAATGLIIVALQIAYLPALYASFNRRETLVTLLESRAASPAWGPELLVRHHLIGLESELGPLYADWERWSADVGESHTTYPSLLYLRSPHPTNSWIVSLVAVLDAAALQLSLQPSSAPTSARMCVRMGFTALRDIAAVQLIPFDPDPLPESPISLTYDEFLAGVQRLGKAGIDMERTPEEAWPHFRGWRINYESIAYMLADRISAPPAPWAGPRPGGRAPILPRRPIDRRPGTRNFDLDSPRFGKSPLERPTHADQPE
jgi:hypothetical protein